MTRQEAIDIFKARMFYNKENGVWEIAGPADLVEALEMLGVIKLEIPKTPTERALEAINKYISMHHRKSPLGEPIPTGECLINILNGAGVRIVEK